MGEEQLGLIYIRWGFVEKHKKRMPFRHPFFLSGKRDSDPRPRPWQGRALPTELFPQMDCKYSIVFLNLQTLKLQTRKLFNLIKFVECLHGGQVVDIQTGDLITNLF